MENTLILNVDDNDAARYVRTRVLQQAGFRVREAANGSEALALISAEPPGLVVLDVHLPDISGHEVCRRIKAQAETAAIPVLHISATYRGTDAQVAGLDAGADAYLTEPVDSEILLATAKALLRMRHMYLELQAEVERRRRAEDALRRRTQALRLLSEAASGLLAQDSPPEELVAALFPAFAGELGLEVYFHYQTIPGDDTRLHLRAYGGVPQEAAKQIEYLDFGQAVCGTVALERRPMIAEDIQHSTDPAAAFVRSAGLGVYVCHPLLANGRLLGTLSFGTRRRPRLDSEEVELLHTLSDQIAMALERRRLRSELLFQASLLGQVRNAVIATDVEGRIVYWNAAGEAMYQWTAAEAIGKNIAEVTVAPGSEVEAAAIMATLARTGHWEGEFRVRRKDGSTFPAFVSDAVIRSAEGSIIGYVGVTADLSGQKEAEESLRRSEQKYRRIVETAAEGIWIIDAEGRTEFVNDRMATMLGYAPAEMRQLAVLDLVFDEDRPALLEQLARRRQGLTDEFELRFRRRDGSEIWTRISASPLHGDDGGFIGVLRMVTDITDRRRAQQSIEESQRKLRRLVEANIIGVITADMERIVEANAIFLETVGYTPEDLAAGRVRWREMTPPEYAEVDRRALEELLSCGVCRTFEKEYYRKDGSRVPILIGAAMVNDKPEWLCFVLDLTERKRAEAAMREIRHIESLGFLAGGVAHNLNNLLVGMMGSASLLLESQLSGPDAELAQAIVDASERAANLTSQLLAYSGKGGYLKKNVAISAIVAELAGVFRASIPRTVDLRLNLASDLPDIRADEGQVRQIITEMVINASEAVGAGPGIIGISTGVELVDATAGAIALELGQLSGGRHIFIEVSDTGSGMDESTRARVFDPFFTTRFTGRGLGLAAVAGIVRSHNGAIAITSAPGEGSTFRVFLPAPE